jgi:hypothetical protein
MPHIHSLRFGGLLVMRYFTDELWKEINSGIKERREFAEKQWERNVEEYAILFENIKHRFSKKFLNIYLKEDNFHDFKLKEIKVLHGKYGYTDPVKVSLVIYNESNVWQLDYVGIEKIALDYKKTENSSSHSRQFQYGFDNFSYDEFFQINDRIMSHEILFASGATLLIYFNKILIKKVAGTTK